MLLVKKQNNKVVFRTKKIHEKKMFWHFFEIPNKPISFAQSVQRPLFKKTQWWLKLLFSAVKFLHVDIKVIVLFRYKNLGCGSGPLSCRFHRHILIVSIWYPTLLELSLMSVCHNPHFIRIALISARVVSGIPVSQSSFHQNCLNLCSSCLWYPSATSLIS